MSYDTGYRRSGSGCGLRLIFAAVILIGGAISYFTARQSNPITHEVQHIKLSPQEEVRLGLESAPEMAAQMGGEVNPNHPMAREVDAIGKKLAGGLPRENPYQFQFHLLRDPETVNAFALPGGQVFITEGLLSRLNNEAQLAGVLGHEIGHVVHRHAAEHMATADFYNSIVAATGVASNDQRAAAVAQYVTQLRQLKYGRNDELESDEWGLKLMSQMGYDPREMLGVMEILQSVSQGRGSEMMSTHPLPASRIEKIKAWLEKTYPGGVPKEFTSGRELRAAPAERP